MITEPKSSTSNDYLSRLQLFENFTIPARENVGKLKLF